MTDEEKRRRGTRSMLVILALALLAALALVAAAALLRRTNPDDRADGRPPDSPPVAEAAAPPSGAPAVPIGSSPFVDRALEELPPGCCEVAVTVVDVDSRPVPGALVGLVGRQTRAVGLADDTGVARLRTYASGTIPVHAAERGFYPAEDRIDLVADARVEKRLVLPPAVRLRVRATGAEGRPMVGARLQLFPEDGDPAEEFDAAKALGRAAILDENGAGEVRGRKGLRADIQLLDASLLTAADTGGGYDYAADMVLGGKEHADAKLAAAAKRTTKPIVPHVGVRQFVSFGPEPLELSLTAVAGQRILIPVAISPPREAEAARTAAPDSPPARPAVAFRIRARGLDPCVVVGRDRCEVVVPKNSKFELELLAPANLRFESGDPFRSGALSFNPELLFSGLKLTTMDGDASGR